MPSSWTSFEDGDPSSPEHFNSKFAPVLSGVSGVLGIEIKSDGSSLGTATTINFVGSSSVSSQAAGQISVAVPAIGGSGLRYARFNSAGSGLTDALLRDSTGTVDFWSYAQPATVAIRRFNGSSSATTDVASNESLGGIDVHAFWSGSDHLVGWQRWHSQSLGAFGVDPRVEWGLQRPSGGSGVSSLVELAHARFTPVSAMNKTMDLGTDGRLWNNINGVTLALTATQAITEATSQLQLTGNYGATVSDQYFKIQSDFSEMRLECQGFNEAAQVRLVLYDGVTAYFSPTTAEPVIRLGSTNRRWHSFNVQGISARALHTLASYSATTADYTISVDSASNLTVTLPNPSIVSGHFYNIKRAGAGTLEVIATSGASIDNVSVYTLASQWSSVQVVSVGTRYLVV